MLRLVLALPRSGRLRVIDVAGLGYVYLMLGLAGVLSCGFALGASLPLRGAGELTGRGGFEAQLDGALLHAHGTIEALTARLGELQARVAQLEVVGEQVTQASHIGAAGLDRASAPPQLGAGGEPFAVLDFVAALEDLTHEVDHRTLQFMVLDRVISERLALAQLSPQALPVLGGRISSGFGMRTEPFRGGTEFHPGMDFPAPVGTAVYAAAAGLVTYAGWRAGYGMMLEIDHGAGLRTRYGHNRANRVKAGDFVQPGQVVAEVGATGRVTGAHLHFEVLRSGKAVNPAPYLQAVTRTPGPFAAAS